MSSPHSPSRPASAFVRDARYEIALAAFQREYPQFDLIALERLRAVEYARLDAQGHVYLDYTGGGLYAESQLAQHQALLRENVFGNPHSSNPTFAGHDSPGGGGARWRAGLFQRGPC
ncbi:MAG: hypothetical protein M5U29_14030 [Anaerolineae bacterium]|nr:hypothetical protein [Anaerolineae bacterium]